MLAEPFPGSWSGERRGLLMLAAMPVFVLASGYLGAEIALRSLRDVLATRPPIVIADVAGALDGIPAGEAEAVITRYNAAAARLADSGVLVLDAQAVLAVPEDAYLRLAEEGQ